MIVSAYRWFALLQILLCGNSGISQVDVLCNISAVYSFVTIWWTSWVTVN